MVAGRFEAFDGKTTEPVTLSAGWTQKNQMSSWFSGAETIDSKGQKVVEFYFNSAGKRSVGRSAGASPRPQSFRATAWLASRRAPSMPLWGATISIRLSPSG